MPRARRGELAEGSLSRELARVLVAAGVATALLREVRSEGGQGSWSRVGSAIVVAALVYAMITTRSIPERTEELAWVLAALYGANQLGKFGKALAEVKDRRAYGTIPKEEKA